MRKHQTAVALTALFVLAACGQQGGSTPGGSTPGASAPSPVTPQEAQSAGAQNVLKYIAAAERNDFAGAARLTANYESAIASQREMIEHQYPRTMWDEELRKYDATLLGSIHGPIFPRLDLIAPDGHAAISEDRGTSVFVALTYDTPESAPFIATREAGWSGVVARRLKSAMIRFELNPHDYIMRANAIPETFAFFEAPEPELIALNWNINYGNQRTGGPYSHLLSLRINGGTRPYALSVFSCSSRTGRTLDLTNGKVTGEDVNAQVNPVDDSITGGFHIGWIGEVAASDIPLNCAVQIADSTGKQTRFNFVISQMPRDLGVWGFAQLCWFAKGFSTSNEDFPFYATQCSFGGVLARAAPAALPTPPRPRGLAGRPRDDFLYSSIHGCIEKENPGPNMTPPNVEAYCVCASNALADQVSPGEARALAQDDPAIQQALAPRQQEAARQCAGKLSAQ